MAFQYTEIGQLIASDPHEARRRLFEQFANYNYSVGEVAIHFGTSPVQIRRWLKRLEAAGLPDPRDGKRATRGLSLTPKRLKPPKRKKSLKRRKRTKLTG